MTRKRILGACLSIAAIALSASTAFADAPLSPALQRSPAREQSSPYVRSDAIAYFRANELSTLIRSAGPAAIAYFEANERATMGPGSYVHVAMRPDPGADASAASEQTTTSGFDWGDAAVGASSAVMIMLLFGGTFLLVRHTRGRELAG